MIEATHKSKSTGDFYAIDNVIFKWDMDLQYWVEIDEPINIPDLEEI